MVNVILWIFAVVGTGFVLIVLSLVAAFWWDRHFLDDEKIILKKSEYGRH